MAHSWPVLASVAPASPQERLKRWHGAFNGYRFKPQR